MDDIEITIYDAEVQGDTKIMNGTSPSDDRKVRFRMEHTTVKGALELLNNMTDQQVNQLTECIAEQVKQMDRRSVEYQELYRLLAETKKPHTSIRRVIAEHLPELVTGTLSNLFAFWITTVAMPQ